MWTPYMIFWIALFVLGGIRYLRRYPDPENRRAADRIIWQRTTDDL